MIRNRVRELLAENAGDRVLGWEAGENFDDRTPAVFDKYHLDELKYDSFCAGNLSKYLIAESAKDGKIIMLVKPCDSYSLNQLCTEHRVNRGKVYALGVGCRGKLDLNRIRAMGVTGDESYNALRISMGRYTTDADIAAFEKALKKVLNW